MYKLKQYLKLMLVTVWFTISVIPRMQKKRSSSAWSTKPTYSFFIKYNPFFLEKRDILPQLVTTKRCVRSPVRKRHRVLMVIYHNLSTLSTHTHSRRLRNESIRNRCGGDDGVWELIFTTRALHKNWSDAQPQKMENETFTRPQWASHRASGPTKTGRTAHLTCDPCECS